MGEAYALIFMARSCPTMIRGSTVGGFLDIEGLTLECGLVAPAVNDLKGGAWLACVTSCRPIDRPSEVASLEAKGRRD